MKTSERNPFSGPVSVFHGKRLPAKAIPAGYAALIDAYGLIVPLPRTLSATGEHHKVFEEARWRIMTPRHAPSASLEGHLMFALKYEGVDLAVLNQLFSAVAPEDLEAIVRAKPTGSYARRIWFFYEWLTGRRLDLPDADRGSYIPAINPDQQYATPGDSSRRHRVRDNLPGTALFCPLVFCTEKLERCIAMNLPERARAIVGDIPRDLLARTVVFLLLKDSKSSYAIEGEHPPQDRIQRWGRVIGEAGGQPLDLAELLRLQKVVIGDARFVQLGLREEGGFVGQHDRDTHAPLPDHISARPEDLPSLIEGMISFDRGPARHLDAVVAAAVLAFGFVYVHPFVDGNGRIHRYLIHHVLAERGFNPSGLVFPVSAAILERIDEYRQVLEDYSERLLPLIEWQPTEDGNVRVLNHTGDYYRFFDATPQAEFLYDCVLKTIDEDLPYETEFLRRYDRFKGRIDSMIEMPDRTVDLLFHLLHQNRGRLSKRAREKEFRALTEMEIARVEDTYAELFGEGPAQTPSGSTER